MAATLCLPPGPRAFDPMHSVADFANAAAIALTVALDLAISVAT
jgi:hypothetical protein